MTINLKRLDKWIEHMKSVPAGKINMSTWVRTKHYCLGSHMEDLRRARLNDCGTTMCAAGHLANLARKNRRFKFSSGEFIPDVTFRWLGVAPSTLEKDMLMVIYTWGYPEPATKRNVIKRLREFRAFVVGRMKQ